MDTSISNSQIESFLEKVNLEGEVHSVFNRVINVINIEGVLYSIADMSIPDSPNMIKIENFKTKMENISIGMNVSLIENILLIEEKEIIDIKNSYKYLLKTVNYPKKLQIETYNQVKKINLKLENTENSIGYYQKNCDSYFDKKINMLLHDNLKLLLEELFKESSSGVSYAVKKLVGLGYGLTPTGDDLLTGILSVITLENYPYHNHIKIMKSAIEQSEKQTNILSYAQILHASKHRINKYSIDFLEALLHFPNDETYLYETLNIATSIGSSSGKDIIAGMIKIIEQLYIQEESKDDTTSKNNNESLC